MFKFLFRVTLAVGCALNFLVGVVLMFTIIGIPLAILFFWVSAWTWSNFVMPPKVNEEGAA